MYKTNIKKSSQAAFSLVEMLMALLVASLLLAALAPVVTKKIEESVSINAGDTVQSKGWRLYNYLSDCTKAEGSANVCEFTDFKVPRGVYAINLVMVSGGGGGAGATPSTITGTKTITKYTTGAARGDVDYDEQKVPITEYMRDVKISRLVGGGGGGGGGAIKTVFVPSASTCSSYGNGGKTDTAGNAGTNFAIFDKANNLCVTKFNQKTATGCYNTYSHVASSGTTNRCSSHAVDNVNILYAYSGCNRWICTYDSAVSACSNLAASTKDQWKLPTSAEFSNWGSVALNLNLCDMHDTVSFSQCTHTAENLYGSYRGCPYKVWGAGTTAFTTGDNNCIGDGIGYTSVNYPQFSFSVRCVLDATYYSLSASGGGSGSLLSDIDISEYVKQAGVGGNIILQAGRGGKGGAGATAVNTKGSGGISGYKSCVKVENAQNKVVYGVCAYQGNGGIPADGSTSAGSVGNAVPSYSYCEETTNGANWHEINCTKGGQASNAGSKTANSTSNGGKGGDSNFPSSSSGGGEGALSNSSSGDGNSPSYTTYAGAGGGGATAKYVKGGSLKAGVGGNGAGGVAQITYKNEYAGSGGGAGSAGSLAIINNLSLPADTECIIHIGGGGAYGSGANGSNGGHTSIKCGKNGQEYIVYGGNGGKTGISGSEISPLPVGGTAGKEALVNSNILQLGSLATITYGEGYSDSSPDEAQSKINDKLNGNKNIGGTGGTSGTGAVGGCGGLKEDEANNCINNLNTNAMTSEFVSPVYTALLAGDYAKAGAAGGGGGWSRGLSPNQGIGSAGQPGYLFLWWDQTAD